MLLFFQCLASEGILHYARTMGNHTECTHTPSSLLLTCIYLPTTLVRHYHNQNLSVSLLDLILVRCVWTYSLTAQKTSACNYASYTYRTVEQERAPNPTCANPIPFLQNPIEGLRHSKSSLYNPMLSCNAYKFPA